MKLKNQHILVINAGSSSIKFAKYSMDEILKKLYFGQISRIGLSNPEFIVTDLINQKRDSIKTRSANFEKAAEELIKWMQKKDLSGKINCIGHRIVHGMEHTHPEIIDNSLLKELYKISSYDPDHLPAEIEIIELFRKKFPGLLQVACFDTSFHTGMPRVAKLLPIPRRFDETGIRRYGFHGLSFTYLMETLKNINGDDNSRGRIILAHLGNGASLAAVKDGKSMDTTMGFTPAGGLVMGTRPGDIDPGVVWYLVQHERLPASKLNHLINHESGLLGVSEISSDMQDLLQKEKEDVGAKEAVALFCYSLKKWIGAFIAVLNGMDTLVFSGGIGEHAPEIRSRICHGLEYCGIKINEKANDKNALIISTTDSKVKVCVIPTDEEIIIAKEAKNLYLKRSEQNIINQ